MLPASTTGSMSCPASGVYRRCPAPLILDEQLAGLYGVETGILSRAVKRNLDRFPPAFMSQLTDEATDALRSQIGISSAPPQQVEVAPPARVELAANGLGIPPSETSGLGEPEQNGRKTRRIASERVAPGRDAPTPHNPPNPPVDPPGTTPGTTIDPVDAALARALDAAARAGDMAAVALVAGEIRARRLAREGVADLQAQRDKRGRNT
jgi:hypothetical protein